MLIKFGLMNQLSSLNRATNSSIVRSAVFRRQQFLIRCFGGVNRMEETSGINRAHLEAYAENVLRAITPKFDSNKYKGQAGN